MLPDIYHFNPTCEYAVANGHISWQPNNLLKKMEEDLGSLPLFLADAKDIILVKKIPSEKFQIQLKKTGFKMPRFLSIYDLSCNNFRIENIGYLLPWGWSPAIHNLLSPLKAYCSKEFYSKRFGLSILKSVLPLLPAGITMGPDMIPEICKNRTEIESLLSRWGKLMIKAPWSSSGRGLQPISKKPVTEKVWEKIMGIIKHQGYAIVEPLHEKKLDMALQFRICRKRISYLGVSKFITDKKGQYQGNILNGWPDFYDPEVISLGNYLPELIKDPLIKAIEKSSLPDFYEGFLGVDTLIFLDRKGKLRVNPCLEINLRQNMGLLSLKLEKLLYPGITGSFRTYYKPGQSFFDFKNEMEKKYPLKYKKNLMASGFMPLTDADEKTLFGAYIIS